MKVFSFQSGIIVESSACQKLCDIVCFVTQTRERFVNAVQTPNNGGVHFSVLRTS